MPFDPTEVRSRDELLMGAIATGDSTVIGDPRDRTEEFIKAIADGIGSAASVIYRHRISLKATLHDGTTMVLNADLLNHNSEDYSDYAAIAADGDHLVDYHYISGSVSNVPGFAIQRINPSGSIFKMTYTYINQNAETKDINGVRNIVDLEYLAQSTIPV